MSSFGKGGLHTLARAFAEPKKQQRRHTMLRIVFGVVVIIHALIHLMGFAKAFNLATLKELSHPPLLPLPGAMFRFTGILWLLACLLLIWAAVAFMLRAEGWLWPALAGIVLSQLLIVLHWHDAKVGTLANLVMLLVLLPVNASVEWNKNAEQAGHELLTTASLQNLPVVQAQQLQHLPPPVQQWLQASGIVGKPAMETVQSWQIATMQIKPGGDDMQVRATQYNRLSEPGFVWQARVNMMPNVYMLGLDRYESGRGSMQIKLLGIYSLTHAQGPQIDQGSLLRFMGEMAWFPGAALQPYITWQAVDNTHAIATMSYGGVSASGTFTFNTKGDVLQFDARRYYDRKDGATLEDWRVTTLGHRTFDGIRIPAQCQVTWRLKDGDFTWYKVRLRDMRYNRTPMRPQPRSD